MKTKQEENYKIQAMLNNVRIALDICEEWGQSQELSVTVSRLNEIFDVLGNIHNMISEIENNSLKAKMFSRLTEMRRKHKYLIQLFVRREAPVNLNHDGNYLVSCGGKIFSAL